MADNGSDEINLRTLRRTDPYVQAILGRASQVAIYQYAQSTQEWFKKEIEGSLFLYSRNHNPAVASHARFGFIIINRLSTTNMMEYIVSSLELSMENPYLLYKNENGEIFGMWFYLSCDCAMIYDMLERFRKMPIGNSNNSTAQQQPQAIANNQQHNNHQHANNKRHNKATVNITNITSTPVLPNHNRSNQGASSGHNQSGGSNSNGASGSNGNTSQIHINIEDLFRFCAQSPISAAPLPMPTISATEHSPIQHSSGSLFRKPEPKAVVRKELFSTAVAVTSNKSQPAEDHDLEDGLTSLEFSELSRDAAQKAFKLMQDEIRQLRKEIRALKQPRHQSANARAK